MLKGRFYVADVECWMPPTTSFNDDSWVLQDKVRNEDIRNQTKLQRMDLIIKERRLRWLGHVLRMEGYQSKPYDGKRTHAPEEDPEGRD